MPTWNYDPKQVSFSLVVNAAAGLEETAIAADDYAEGTFIRASRSTAMFSKRVGATGAVTRSKRNDKSGQVALTLEAGSSINAKLQSMYDADEDNSTGFAALLIKDSNGSDVVVGKNAWIVGPPEQNKGTEAGAVEWVFDVDVLQITHGGLAEM